MQEEYEKSIQRIKKLKRLVSPKEWNQIAKEENLLSSESLKFIAKKNFVTIQIEVREGRKQNKQNEKIKGDR